MRNKNEPIICRVCGKMLADYTICGVYNKKQYPYGRICEPCAWEYFRVRNRKVMLREKDKRAVHKPMTEAEMRAWNEAHPIKWERPTIEELAGSSTGCNKIGSGGKVNGMLMD